MGFNDINLQVSGPQQPASIYKTKVMKGQVPFAVQVTEPNTKYVIKHNFDLGGTNVTIPANCILEFDGGSLSNGTLNPNGCYINGYRGFDKTLVWSNDVDCNVSNDAIEFDWWKTEKVTLSQYRTFIANGQLTGTLPTITDTNRTILQNIPKWTLNRNGIKFGKGIYPFDNYVTMIGDTRIFGECEHETLLWAPQSDLLHYSGGYQPSISNLFLEANGKVFFTSGASNLGLHRPSIKNCTLISYNDNAIQCGNDDGTERNVPYGGFFRNLKVSGGPNKSAFRQFVSNSMVYDNVVDADRLYSNSANVNARGMMFSFFYNCNIQEFKNANVTYSGFKYFYYVGNESYANALTFCRIYNSTFEGGNSDYSLIANIIKIVRQQTSVKIVMKDITYISNNFEYASPIVIENGASAFDVDIDTSLVFLVNGGINNFRNLTNHPIYTVFKTGKTINKYMPLKEITKGYVSTNVNFQTRSTFNINDVVNYIFMPSEVKQCAAAAEFGTSNGFTVYMNVGEKCYDDCANQLVQGATNYAWKTVYTQSIDGRILTSYDIGTSILYNGKPLVYDGTNFVDGVGAVVLYGRTYNLTGLYTSNNNLPVNGSNYYFRLYPLTGYTLPSSVTITMGGSTLTAGTDYTYDSTTGAINILGTGGTGGVTGVVVITATGTTV